VTEQLTVYTVGDRFVTLAGGVARVFYVIRDGTVLEEHDRAAQLKRSLG
jgi:hypothetical protein